MAALLESGLQTRALATLTIIFESELFVAQMAIPRCAIIDRVQSVLSGSHRFCLWADCRYGRQE